MISVGVGLLLVLSCLFWLRLCCVAWFCSLLWDWLPIWVLCLIVCYWFMCWLFDCLKTMLLCLRLNVSLAACLLLKLWCCITINVIVMLRFGVCVCVILVRWFVPLICGFCLVGFVCYLLGAWLFPFVACLVCCFDWWMFIWCVIARLAICLLDLFGVLDFWFVGWGFLVLNLFGLLFAD